MELCVLIIFVFAVLVPSSGKRSVRFDEKSLMPDEERFIFDKSRETCASFMVKEGRTTPQYTSFRVNVLDLNADGLDVILIGSKLGCGHNLYVSPLSVNETEDWMGRWRTCPLKDVITFEDKDQCLYQCQCRDPCVEIQVFRMPSTKDDSSWTICHMCISIDQPYNYEAIECNELCTIKSGMYVVKLNPGSTAVSSNMGSCDMTTDGGGWTVILKRLDGSQNFSLTWSDYERGFGFFTDAEYWAGNVFIHKITTSMNYSLRIDLESFDGERIYALYRQFKTDSKESNYKLHIGDFCPKSTAGDSLGAHDGMMFSTSDKDNDQAADNCALRAGGSGWWFNACQTALLTGVYGENISWEKGIYWEKPWGRTKLAKYASMMIRPTT